MTRPLSHRDQVPLRRCGNCKFANLVAYKLDLLCFHGDGAVVTGKSNYPVDADFVEIGGEEVGLLDGDEYDRIWSQRIVDSDDVCDEWQESIAAKD